MAQNLSEAERLMAEMSAKYGVSSKPVEQPTQAPKQVAPPPQPQQQRGLVGDAMNLITGRKAQIDKASGYACGGKIKAHAQGGKISGPGTPTSDSIPAVVRDTGEKIYVSNKERIVSAKQDAALARIAEMLGYASVDAMFEKMTGEPVGPTMKNGKRAAAGGMYDETLDDIKNVAKDAFPGTYAALNESGKDVQSALNEGRYADALGHTARGAMAGTVGVGADILGSANAALSPLYRAAKTAITGNSATPSATPATLAVVGSQGNSATPGATPDAPSVASVQPTPTAGIITNDSVKERYAKDGGLANMKSGQYYSEIDLAGQNDRMAKSLGYASAADFNQQKAGTPAGGIAILNEGAPAQAERDNAEKARRWMAEDMMKRDKRGGVQAASHLMGLDTTERGQDLQERVAGLSNMTAMRGQDVTAQRAAGHDQAIMRGQDMQYGNPLDQQVKQLGVDQAKKVAMLQEKAAAGDANALNELRVRGIIKSEQPKFSAHVVGGGADEMGRPLPQRLAITDDRTGASRFADEKQAQITITADQKKKAEAALPPGMKWDDYAKQHGIVVR